MFRSLPVRPRVLCYGNYRNLLLSRRMLLQAIGCNVDIADSSAEVRKCLDSQPEYTLAVLCHTLTARERTTIGTTLRAQHPNTAIYALEGTVEPQEFMLHASELVKTAGSSHTSTSGFEPVTFLTAGITSLRSACGILSTSSNGLMLSGA